MNATYFPAKLKGADRAIYRLVDNLSDSSEINYARYQSGSRQVYYKGKTSLHALRTVAVRDDAGNETWVCVPGRVITRVMETR